LIFFTTEDTEDTEDTEAFLSVSALALDLRSPVYYNVTS